MKKIYKLFVASIFLLQTSLTLPEDTGITVTDFSRVNKAVVDSIECPKSIEELRHIVVHADKPVAIAGGKYSMGGQVWCEHGIMIDMKHFNHITGFDLQEKTIRVQSGACWSDVQKFLLPYNLTVQVMQSFNDFTVGGSLAVNVHGRDQHGQIINTVKSMTVLLADGSVVTASRSENYDLFRAVIGGYGSCGIIIDATLAVEDNYKIKRVLDVVDIQDFPSFYRSNIADNQDVSLWSGFLYGPDFVTIINFSWHKTDDALTTSNMMRHESGFLHTIKTRGASLVESLLTEFSGAQRLRLLIDVHVAQKMNHVVWRSYEMSRSVDSFPASNDKVAKILQEYFIPVNNFDAFVTNIKDTFSQYGVNVLNISIRHVPANTESMLSYAQQDCFAFVCYFAIDNTLGGREYAQLWTQKLINTALQLDGTYYLPYHLFATKDQFMQAHPTWHELCATKKIYDPSGLFQNSLLEKYQN